MNIKGFGNSPISDLKTQQPSSKAEKAARSENAATESSASGTNSTTVELSSKARGLKEIERSLADLPEVDSNRVRDLRARIESGEYQVDSSKVAEKLLGIEESF